jgi:hypothetical protein
LSQFGEGYLAAHQALALVAYADPEALTRLPPGMPDMLRDWGYASSDWNAGRRTPPLWRLRWVYARARWHARNARREPGRRSRSLTPLPAKDRAFVRRCLRQHGISAAQTIFRLQRDIERARAAAATQLEQLERANRELRRALSSGRVRVLGRRGNAYTSCLTSSEHEEVPLHFFLHEHRIIDPEEPGWATLDPCASEEELMRLATEQCPDWGDLRFSEKTLRQAFPPAYFLQSGVKPHRTGTEGRPTSMHFIRPEHERRLASGAAYPTLAQEARHLRDWFGSTYPDLPLPSTSTLENALRARHRKQFGAP